MGPVLEPQAHQGALRPEDLCEDLLQGLPAQIIVAVARGPGKASLADPVLPEGLQHLFRIFFRDPVDLPEAGKDALLGFPGQILQFVSHHHSVSRNARTRREIFSKSFRFPTQEGEWI